MKKGVQIAFAIALFILAIISSFVSTGHMASIIYAVVIPSFLLSLISFVTEIAEKCNLEGEELYKVTHHVADLARDIAEKKIKGNLRCNNDAFDAKTVITPEVNKYLEEENKHLIEAVGYQKTRLFFMKCKTLCDKVTVGGYVLLFLSLALSPYISQWLSVIDLNSITMWSLVLLYFTLELKTEICSKLFFALSQNYIDRVKKELEEEECES